MSRSEEERFADILDAIQRCQDYAPHLRSDDLASMAYDALLRNLAVIGEAVRSLPSETREAMPDVPWASIAGLRNMNSQTWSGRSATADLSTSELVVSLVDLRRCDATLGAGSRRCDASANRALTPKWSRFVASG